jgi:6-phosphogluconolactonase (cycloisomerase 2 family)
VVNAGSDEISVFRIHHHGLVLTDKVPSGGEKPVSIAVHKNLVYVLNAGGSVGGSDNIAGFTMTHSGHLVPLPGSSRPLSTDSTGPAQISFSPDGWTLVVTEKGTNSIDTFVVDYLGYADGPIVHPSEGETPFGFSFGKHHRLFVSEAFGGMADAGAASSYRLLPGGGLKVIDPSVPTTETATCWLVVSKTGRYAYTTNTGSGTVTGYRIGFFGALHLLDADGVTGVTGAGSAPIDMSFSRNGRYLYTLNSGNGTLSAFRVAFDGSLDNFQTVPGIPEGANGLASR